MQIEQSQVKGFTVISVKGELDINSSPDLKAVLTKLIDKKIFQMMVNLEGVTYIDSSGLATLIETVQHVRKGNGVMSLVGMSAKIKNLFEITKLDRLFKIYSTQEEALSQLVG